MRVSQETFMEKYRHVKDSIFRVQNDIGGNQKYWAATHAEVQFHQQIVKDTDKPILEKNIEEKIKSKFDAIDSTKWKIYYEEQSKKTGK